MKIILLHLSDIHLKINEKQNPILGNSQKIAQAVYGCVMEPEAIFVTVTGDIAHSGITEEYIFAEKLFTEIKSELRKIYNIPVYLIFVPGNHDCEITTPNSARDILISNLSVDVCDDSIIENSVSVQNSYFEFRQNITEKPIKNIKEKLFETCVFDVNNHNIKFNLLNSAWMFSLEMGQGKLQFPTQFIKDSHDDINIDVSISLIHHPQSWFENSNGRMLKKELEKISDIILTGHEHDGNYFKKIDSNNGNEEFIEGDVLQESASIKNSGFFLLELDLESKTQNIYHFKWESESKYYKNISETRKIGFLRNINRLKNEYVLKNDFESVLNDAGAKYSHPYKDNIELDDIFIYPDIKILPAIGDIKSKAKLVQRPIIDFLYNNNYIFLIGQEKCGKTSLAKKTFLDLKTKGLIPLLINGIEIKNYDEEGIIKLLEKKFSNEYSTSSFEQFRQLPIDNKVIIIDDFDKVHLNSRGRDKFLSIIKLIFYRIIIFGTNELRIRDIVNTENEKPNIFDFIECNLLEFGFQRRSELIEKWYLLGQEFYIDESDLSHKTINSERIITSLIGKNFIPSYPIFILALLQQQEVKVPIGQSNPQSTTGSYGFLYESLLTAVLYKSSIMRFDLGTLYAYLSELAFFYFKNRKKRIDIEQMQQWHNYYCDEYSRHFELNEILTGFQEASILGKENNLIFFKYPYLYYYFVGRYFRDHMGEEIIKTHIENMSRKIYHTESSNILLFLCYLSTDPYIINTILSSSKTLFEDCAEFNIVDDSEFLSQIAQKITKVVLPPNSPKENRKNLLEKRDEFAEVDKYNGDEKDEDLDYDLDKKEPINEALQITAAFKTVQLLGQILRNFQGSLKGKQKLALVQECYSLGMRILKFIFSMVEENNDDLLNALVKMISQSNPQVSNEHLIEDAKTIICMLLEGSTFSVIRYISDSLGHEELDTTFNEILKINTQNVSYRFIDVSVRLDYFFDNFPENEVNSLNKELKNKVFSRDILRRLVWHHFYLYPSDFRLRARICEKLDIDLQLGKVYDPRTKMINPYK